MARKQGVPRSPRTLYLNLDDYRALSGAESFLTTPQLVELLLAAAKAGHLTVDTADVPPGTGQANLGMSDTAYADAEQLVEALGLPNVAALVRALLRAHMSGAAVVSLYATDRRKTPRSAPTLTVSPPTTAPAGLPPHEDPTLPPQLREALGIMAERGPVVEMTMGADGAPVPKTTGAAE